MPYIISVSKQKSMGLTFSGSLTLSMTLTSWKLGLEPFKRLEGLLKPPFVTAATCSTLVKNIIWNTTLT